MKLKRFRRKTLYICAKKVSTHKNTERPDSLSDLQYSDWMMAADDESSINALADRVEYKIRQDENNKFHAATIVVTASTTTINVAAVSVTASVAPAIDFALEDYEEDDSETE